MDSILKFARSFVGESTNVLLMTDSKTYTPFAFIYVQMVVGLLSSKQLVNVSFSQIGMKASKKCI